jgi:hypothetical protein
MTVTQGGEAASELPPKARRFSATIMMMMMMMMAVVPPRIPLPMEGVGGLHASQSHSLGSSPTFHSEAKARPACRSEAAAGACRQNEAHGAVMAALALLVLLVIGMV